MMPSAPRSLVLARFVFAVGLMATMVPFLAKPAFADGRTLRGTWIVQVSLLTSCTGGSELPPFWSMVTFASGGTLSGTTMSQAFAPGQRSADHGTWARARGGDYTASSLAFINFPTPPAPPASPGFQTGAQRIDQVISLTDTDTFTSTATVTFFDTNSQLYREGCAVATGHRFK